MDITITLTPEFINGWYIAASFAIGYVFLYSLLRYQAWYEGRRWNEKKPRTGGNRYEASTRK